MSAFLRLHNLTKTYREGHTQRVVLRQANATFQQGESVAVVGKSGSGKSTLLNLISGIDRPDSGSIYIGNQDLTQMDEHSRTLFRRRKIGFIFQFFNLIPTLTVGENVTLPLELNGIARARAAQRARTLLAEVGLADRWETFPEALSGGEQQRVAIARALIHDPLLILADEPTGNLDEETGAQVLDLLSRLTRHNHSTIIMVTHSPEVAARADRVLHLRLGKLHPA
ncbi:MAG: ABC transporter ATP-binding protein [Anaerolineae bacterium]|nr:MAG: ABC transporter ATP-binding protein [Anaerolineae bacterium]